MLRIEHDPDAGCSECPLADVGREGTDEDGWHEFWCRLLDRDSPRLSTVPAPEWCPLRSGGVLVTRGTR